MRILFAVLLLIISNDPKEIAKANTLKKEAEQAFLEGDYETAVKKYQFLLDSMEVEDDLIKLNLGHAYYHLGDSAGAKSNYGKAGMSVNNELKSIAYQQLGVMSKDANKLEQSLQQLKSAIKADPANRDAIYDYEVVKKLLEEQKQQEQQQQEQDNENKENEEKKEEQNEDQQNQDQKNENGEQENKDQKGENNEQQENEQEQQEQENQEEGEQQEQEQEKSQEEMTKEKLQEMGISEEKARQLLEAMRQSEIKYLQNQKRKATKRPPSGKPDW